MSDYPGLDNAAERKRLFEQLFIAGMASGKSVDQLTLECGIIVDRLCPKRTYKPTPTPGPGRIIRNSGATYVNLGGRKIMLLIIVSVAYVAMLVMLTAYAMGIHWLS